MTRDDTIALWRKCEEARAAALLEDKPIDQAHEAAKAIWNAWANEMIAERRALERSGCFRLSKETYRVGWPVLTTTGQNDATNEWLLKSTIIFSEYNFVDFANFSQFIFPWIAIFGKIKVIKHYRSQENTIFEKQARFFESVFCLDADFEGTVFRAETWFDNTIFFDVVHFSLACFCAATLFYRSKFKGEVWFGECKFSSFTAFIDCEFQATAAFPGIECKSTFDLGNAVFREVPIFIQAHFEEAPRLDNISVAQRMFASSPQPRSIPARWRALKRLAIQGQDTDRELEFFSCEIRSARFAGDWPFPWPIWKAEVWTGFLRFWAGLLYEVFSNFGRSLVRPFFAWSLCIIIFAVYFLGQNPDMTAKRKQLHGHGFIEQVVAYSTTAWNAVSGKAPVACVSKTLPTGDSEKDSQNGFTGLAEPVRERTNPIDEALSIAYHILRRRRHVPARVIVRHNDSHGIMQYRGREYVAGMDDRGVDRPYRYDLFVYQLMPCIEIQAHEMLFTLNFDVP